MLRTRVSFVGTQGTPYYATHYFAGTGSVMGGAALAATSAFWNDLEAAMSNNLTWTSDPEVVEMTEAGVITSSFANTNSSGTGTATSEEVALAVQGLIQWRTGVYLGGREVRGRTFVPGATEGMNAGGLVLAATQTVMNNAAINLIDLSGVTPVVWSRKNAQAIPITQGTAWEQWAMLTSRRD